MPIYRSAGVEISLATTKADRLSLSNHNASLLKIAPTKQNNSRYDDWSDANTLIERPVVDDNNPGPMRYAGSMGDAPFFLVQVLDDSHGSNRIRLDGSPRKRAFIKSAIQQARPLCLQVDLSHCHYLSKKTHRDARNVKIEVFYNGEITNCFYLKGGSDRNTGTYQDSRQIFSGRRVSVQAERPWVLAPRSGCKTSSAQQTLSIDAEAWQKVSRLLEQEAELRGVDKFGQISPVSDYLRSIADLPMPNFKRASTRDINIHMGIIDIVVSLGLGSKDAHEYSNIAEPTRLRDSRFTRQNLAERSNITPQPRPLLVSTTRQSQELSRPSNVDVQPAQAFSMSRSQSRPGRTSSLIVRLKMKPQPEQLSPSILKRNIATILGIQEACRKRRRLDSALINKQHIDTPQASRRSSIIQMDPRPLLSQTHHSFSDFSRTTLISGTPTPTPAGRKTPPSSAISMSPDPLLLSGAQALMQLRTPTLRVDRTPRGPRRPQKQAANPRHSIAASASSSDLSLLSSPLELPAPDSAALLPTGAVSDTGRPTSKPAQDLENRTDHLAQSNTRKAKRAVEAKPDKEWHPSELSKRSIFTYAEPWMCQETIENMTKASITMESDERNDVQDSGPKKPTRGQMYKDQVLRQVRKERPGEFTERSILLGVRYVMI